MNLEDVLLIGTRSAQPLATDVAAGMLYSVTDEDNLVEQSRGGVWITYAGAGSGSSSSGGQVANFPFFPDLTEVNDEPFIIPTPIPSSAGGGGGSTISTSAEGSEPAAVAGDVNLPNNAPYIKRYNGSIWVPWGPIYPFTEPIDGDFAWINQGGASVSTTNGGVILSCPAGAGDNIRIRKKAAPATPYTITAYIQPLYGKRATSGFGIGFRQSSDGKLHTLSAGQHETNILYSVKFSNPTTYDTIYLNPVMNTLNMAGLPPKFFRIQDNGTSRICSVSSNGITWLVFHTIGRTDYLTADEVLFFCNSVDVTEPSAIHLLSWVQS